MLLGAPGLTARSKGATRSFLRLLYIRLSEAPGANGQWIALETPIVFYLGDEDNSCLTNTQQT